jgi:hypothetical protein
LFLPNVFPGNYIRVIIANIFEQKSGCKFDKFSGYGEKLRPKKNGSPWKI